MGKKEKKMEGIRKKLLVRSGRAVKGVCFEGEAPVTDHRVDELPHVAKIGDALKLRSLHDWEGLGDLLCMFLEVLLHMLLPSGVGGCRIHRWKEGR